MLKCRKGFTLVELIVVMAIFMSVIMITTDAFKTILTQMTKITKSEESNIEGIIGLEMLRHDIQQAGYGLPFSFMNTLLTYTEASSTPASNYNDAPSGLPRALVAADNLPAGAGPSGTATTLVANTDYLALKASTLGLSEASQRWTYLPYDSTSTQPHVWQAENLASTDRVILLRRSFVANAYRNELVCDTSSPANYSQLLSEITAASPSTNVFVPTLENETYFIYGINGGGALGMPFNRADYFVATPTTAGSFPDVCAPGTGILYKAVVNHAGGASTYVPLLDCVADMQVILGWDLDDGMGNEGQDGLVETYTSPLNSGGTISDIASSSPVALATMQARATAAFGDPERLRNSLKVIKMYILAQVGRRDSNYTSPATFAMSDPTVDLSAAPKTLVANQLNYHWKVYRIVTRPKNLLANQ